MSLKKTENSTSARRSHNLTCQPRILRWMAIGPRFLKETTRCRRSRIASSFMRNNADSGNVHLDKTALDLPNKQVHRARLSSHVVSQPTPARRPRSPRNGLTETQSLAQLHILVIAETVFTLHYLGEWTTSARFIIRLLTTS